MEPNIADHDQYSRPYFSCPNVKEKIAVWLRETKAKPSAILGSRLSPSVFFSILHLWQCFNWFIVLAGLFEQIVKVLLGDIERQSTRKVHNLALADHLKAVCLC